MPFGKFDTYSLKDTRRQRAALLCKHRAEP